jgi:hypothetical protein
MAKPSKQIVRHPEAISTDELRRILGDIEESRLLAILALRPTIAEVEEAALWNAGSGDLVSRAGHPLTGVAAQIFEILAVDDEESRDPS